jgi:ABC-type sugar transport system ATPase subunit
VDINWERNIPLEKINDVTNYSEVGFNNVSINFKKGEIVSLTGLLGPDCFEFARSFLV